MESDSSVEDFEGFGPDEAAEAINRYQTLLEREGIGDGPISESESESDNDDRPPATADGWHHNFDYFERGMPVMFDPRSATGPTQILDPEKNIIDFFQLFFTDEIIAYILNETDRYANQEKQSNPDKNKMAWHRPTMDEMKAFFGICFLMGIDKKPSIRLYWSTDYFMESPVYSKTMNRDRFLQIMRYLHFANNENALQPGQPGYDILFKIRYVLNEFNAKMKYNYVPRRQVSVDECMVPFKGRVKFKQYLPRKPVKWGIKLWALADAKSSYVCYVNVYTGRDDNRIEGTLASNVVQKCLEGAEIRGRGYHIFMDNYFTSPALLLSLWEFYGTGACGTVRKIWRDLPDDFRRKRIENVNIRGDIQFRQKGPLLAVAWKDKKIVTVLSTIHDQSTTFVQRSVQNRATGQFERQDVNCPVAVAHYSQYMGGVDKADQYTQYYAFSQKTLKWHKRIFFRLLEIIKYCAFVCFFNSPNHQPEPGKPQVTFLKFTQELVQGLVNGYQQDRRHGRPPLLPIENRLLHRHLPGTFETRSWCHVCYMRVTNGRQQNRKQTKYGCLECGKHLCLPGCFSDYHSLRNYYQ